MGDGMKFLVIWSFKRVTLTPDLVRAVLDTRSYAKRLKDEGKLEAHYHIVGKHGGAWIFDVVSNEELENLLAGMPVYNLAEYEVYPLAEMR
ncbi:MAG: YciI family protein [Candidatus Nitrosocaldus sp.]|nr:YciI family protein [Candidatus Nitrosocaldus sp.]MDW8000825.1 muconolactone Delta-isomerase family protein [Candidatus Nitrosocaldus sp.]